MEAMDLRLLWLWDMGGTSGASGAWGFAYVITYGDHVRRYMELITLVTGPTEIDAGPRGRQPDRATPRTPPVRTNPGTAGPRVPPWEG